MLPLGHPLRMKTVALTDWRRQQLIFSAVAWWATTRVAPTNATTWTTTRGAHANAAGLKGLFRAVPSITIVQKRPKGPQGRPACAVPGTADRSARFHHRGNSRAAPACLCVARRQAGRRPSFSAFFPGGQRTSTCRFTSSAFLPLSSQERGPGG